MDLTDDTPVAGALATSELPRQLGVRQNRSGIGRRIIAVLFDGFLLGILLEFATRAGIPALLAVGGLYSLVEAFTGWTLGKLVLGLRIRNADATPGRRPVLFRRWGFKNSAYILGTASMVTGIELLSWVALAGALGLMIGGLWIIGANRQGLHDKLARTAVFRASAVRTVATAHDREGNGMILS